MSVHKSHPFVLREGIDAYGPEVSSDKLSFAQLRSVEPRLARLFAARGYEIFNDIGLSAGDRITGFGYYTLSNRQFSNVYAFSRTSIYWFDFEAGAFSATAIYTSFPASDDPPVVIPWFDCMYVTKFGGKYVKVERTVTTEIAGAPSGRYGILANSHAMLANVTENMSASLARIRWSDLDAPESFILNPLESEADFFDLEATSQEITGLSYQRGSPLAYSISDVWIGSYLGFPASFRWEPLFPGLGNIFHNAVVRNKEVDYFIGADNIYAINGLQVNPIGDEIFERFINDVKIVARTSVRGYIDTRKTQVFWVYTNNDDELWSIVYNYKEAKWSERDPQDISAWFDTPRVMFRGYNVIDDYDSVSDDIIDDQSELIDDPDAGFPLRLPQLSGGLSDPTTPVIAKATDARLKLDGSSFASEIETFDFFFEDIEETKEVTKATIEYTGLGQPDIRVEIGSRHNQSEDIVWSSPIGLTNQGGSLNFFFRSEGVGKYLRFRLTWNNTDTAYIDDLRFLSLKKVENGDDPAEK